MQIKKILLSVLFLISGYSYSSDGFYVINLPDETQIQFTMKDYIDFRKDLKNNKNSFVLKNKSRLNYEQLPDAMKVFVQHWQTQPQNREQWDIYTKDLQIAKNED